MTIHALLIAISDYPTGVSDLPGCANDLVAFEAFFKEYATLNGVGFKPKVLLNEAAHRKGVLQSFAHFEQAGPEDVCLLYYTGHGSQLPAPPEFWHQEKDRKCEALVLHDYGKPGGGYLADKEISYLLATHTKQAGQVLVIADSCHSGTISRMATAVPRTTAFNGLPLNIEDFHGWEYYRKEESFLSPPIREHITLAACRPEQVAMEMPIKNVRRGLFTHYLLEVMRTNDLSTISYAELADRVRVRVKNHYRKQDVYAETTPGSSLNVPFLGGELKRSHNLLLHYGKGIGWYFDQGEIAGIKVGNEGSALVGETEEVFTVKRVDAGRSYVENASWMEVAQAPFPIVDLDKQGTPMAVYLDRTKMSSVVAGALAERIQEETDTLLLVEEPEEAKYHVVYTPTYGIHLVLPGEERPLFEGTTGQSEGWAVKFADQLSRVSTYEATLGMAPTNRVLDLDKVLDIQLEQVYINDFEEVVEVSTKATDGTAVFPYYHDEFTDSVEPPLVRLKIKVKNDYPGVLYAGMLFLDESFGISGQAMRVNALQAGEGFYQTKVSRPADPDDPDSEEFPQSFFSLVLSDTLQSWGLTEITNYLKIIVSETPIELAGY
ncbi:MAG: caspase family protein, partial [Bacteroidota bacterium]